MTDADADLERIVADLHGLAETASSETALLEFEETHDLLAVAGERGLIPSGVRRLQRRDAAEALVGSVVFASPLLVEDGVFDIAEHLFRYSFAGVPVFLIANTAFIVLLTFALLEWTGRNREEAEDWLGVVPVRLVMVLVVSLTAATVLMTLWGRVGAWQQPAEALARINVFWTVGAIGGALGDVIAGSDTPSDSRPMGDVPDRLDDPEAPSDAELLTSLGVQFTELEAAVATDARREEVRHLRAETIEIATADRFGQRIRKYTTRDVAEAFVGSVIFSIPLLVEDGVFDVADYFLGFRVGGFPTFFLLNAGFVLLMIVALVYWAGPQEVRISRPLFGLLPRRLVGIALVSFLTAALLMTMWGRVGHWADPIVAVARISVVWTVAAFGAALGDILPGESSGADINDELGELPAVIDDTIERFE